MHGLLIAEKPSVMREVQAVYKKEASKLPFTLDFAAFHGHLMELQNPEDYNPSWSDWNKLPIIPTAFSYKAVDVKSVNLLADRIKNGNYDFLVNACDAGREGEHIFWSFYETLGLKLPVKRFWASSVTGPALKKALNDIQDSNKFDGLRQSAKYRAQFDWLVGMNFTRAATIKHGELTSIGRVQTPTLKLIVDRELQIRNFVPEDFFELKGTFKINGTEVEMTHLIAPDLKDTHFSNKADASAIESDVKKKAPGTVLGMKNEIKSKSAPTLYSLTELQKEANRHLKFKPDKTLDIAQKLYEAGLLTYPRTESRFLPTDMIPEIADHIKPLNSVPEIAPYAAGIGQAEIDTMLKGKYVDDAGITDHHAIIPTDQAPNWSALSNDEKALYTLVGKSFLAIFMPPHQTSASSILVSVGEHIFRARGNVDIDLGYSVLYPKKKKAAIPLPVCKKGDPADLLKTKISKGTTKAPDRYNPDSILTAMLNAGQALSDDAMRSVLRETEGLGTPATRASILKKLEDREYVKFERNAYYALDKGIRLIEVVGDRAFSSAALTAEWEKKLLAIEKGSYQGDFKQEMEKYTVDETNYLLSNLKSTVGQVIGKCPFCGGNVIDRGKIYACEHRVKGDETTCQAWIPKTLGTYEVTEDDINALLAGQKTEPHFFTHPKTKNSWTASLVLDKNKGTVFCTDEQVIGTCPFCGGAMKSVGKVYVCENRKKDDPSTCQVILSKELCGYTFTEDDLKELLAGKQTSVKEFTSKGKKWNAAIILDPKEGSRFIFTKDEVGPCPLCGEPVYAVEKSFYCSSGADGCGWSFPRTIKGTRLSDKDVKTMLRGQKTRPLTFTWKSGKQGLASLYLNDDGSLGWDFKN